MADGDKIVKINLFSKEEDATLWQHAEQFEGVPGHVYVFGHGATDSIRDDRNGKANAPDIDALDLAKMLADKNVKEDAHIVLHSCNVARGQHSFARNLSHYYAVVEGATGLLYDSSSKNEEEWHQVSTVSDGGKIKRFYSEDYNYSLQHPSEVDSEHSQIGAQGYNSYKGADGITHYGKPVRDLGETEPFINGLSPRPPASARGNAVEDFLKRESQSQHTKDMANSYADAVNPYKTGQSGELKSAQEINNAIENAKSKFSELDPLFSAREKLVKQESQYFSKPEALATVLNGIDGYIKNAIAQGNVNDGVNYMNQFREGMQKQHIAELGPEQ
jgi:hypothetical protein